LQTICVHSRAWHEAGGSAVQELAYTLATGVEYLRQLDKLGVDVNMLPRRAFASPLRWERISFMEIAKLRALRMLWSRVVAAAWRRGGAENFPARSHLAVEQDGR
jgi:methylmalonyl-CoA mutase